MKPTLIALLASGILSGCTTNYKLEDMQKVNPRTLEVLKQNPTQPGVFTPSISSGKNYQFEELPSTRTDIYFIQGTNTIKIPFDSTGIINSGNTLDTVSALEDLLAPSNSNEGALEFTASRKGKALLAIQNYAHFTNSAMQINLSTVEGSKDRSKLEIKFGALENEFSTNIKYPIRASSLIVNPVIGGVVAGPWGAGGVLVYEAADSILTNSKKPIPSISRNSSPFSGNYSENAALSALGKTEQGYNLIALNYGSGTALVYLSDQLSIGNPEYNEDKGILQIPFTGNNDAVRRALLGAIGAASRYNPKRVETRTTILPNNNGGGRVSGPGAN